MLMNVVPEMAVDCDASGHLRRPDFQRYVYVNYADTRKVRDCREKLKKKKVLKTHKHFD